MTKTSPLVFSQTFFLGRSRQSFLERVNSQSRCVCLLVFVLETAKVPKQLVVVLRVLEPVVKHQKPPLPAPVPVRFVHPHVGQELVLDRPQVPVPDTAVVVSPGEESRPDDAELVGDVVVVDPEHERRDTEGEEGGDGYSEEAKDEGVLFGHEKGGELGRVDHRRDAGEVEGEESGRAN